MPLKDVAPIPDPDPVDAALADLRVKQAAVTTDVGSVAAAQMAATQASAALASAQQQLATDVAARDQSRAALEALIESEYTGP